MKTTVHGAPWSDLKNKKVIVVRAAEDVNIDLYCRQSCVIFHAIFLALIVMQLSDSNNSIMEKMYYYVHKATLEIKKNSDYLNNPIMFMQSENDNGENGYDYLEFSVK